MGSVFPHPGMLGRSSGRRKASGERTDSLAWEPPPSPSGSLLLLLPSLPLHISLGEGWGSKLLPLGTPEERVRLSSLPALPSRQPCWPRWRLRCHQEGEEGQASVNVRRIKQLPGFRWGQGWRREGMVEGAGLSCSPLFTSETQPPVIVPGTPEWPVSLPCFMGGGHEGEAGSSICLLDSRPCSGAVGTNGLIDLSSRIIDTESFRWLGASLEQRSESTHKTPNRVMASPTCASALTLPGRKPDVSPG